MRVHTTGRKAYVVQSRGPGGLKRVTLGHHGDLATDEARKRAATVIDRIKRGEAPVSAPPVPELSVAALAERYMHAHVLVRCKPSTAATYRFVLDKHILPALGETPVGAVGRSDIAALHHRLRTTPTIANAAVDILSKMFSLAEAWDRIPPGRNPCRAVRRYKTRTRERFLTQEEFRRLGRVLRDAEADGSVWPPAVAAIRLLLLTGCRRSEILTLHWDDVDRTAVELRLRDSKTGPHMVPLTRAVAAVLDGIARVCLVADAGMISKKMIAAVEARGWFYILGARLRRTKEVRDVVLSDTGAFETIEVARQRPDPMELQVKEVTVNDTPCKGAVKAPHKPRRYVVCRNPDQARKDAGFSGAL